jgi:hypothetical protein
MDMVRMAKKYRCNGTTREASSATGVMMRTTNRITAVVKESDTVDIAVKPTIRARERQDRMN